MLYEEETGARRLKQSNRNSRPAGDSCSGSGGGPLDDAMWNSADTCSSSGRCFWAFPQCMLAARPADQRRMKSQQSVCIAMLSLPTCHTTLVTHAQGGTDIRLHTPRYVKGPQAGLRSAPALPDNKPCGGWELRPLARLVVELAPGRLAGGHLDDGAGDGPDVGLPPVPDLLDDLGRHPVRRSLDGLAGLRVCAQGQTQSGLATSLMTSGAI